MTSPDMLARVALAANELRLVQAEMAQADPQRRAVEFARVIETHLASHATFEERQRFLAVLDERFPVLAIQAQAIPSAETQNARAAELESVRQRASRLEAELADPFKLVARLAEHWSGVPESKKVEMLDILRRRGPVPAGTSVPSMSATVGDTASGIAKSRPAATQQSPAAIGAGSSADEIAIRELAKWVGGTVESGTRRPPAYARLAIMLRTLLEHLDELDKVASAVPAALDVPLGSLKVPLRDDLKKAVREFLQFEGDLDWDKLQQLKLNTLTRRYLKDKRVQFEAQLGLVLLVIDPLQSQLMERFRPEILLQDAEKHKAANSSTFGFSGVSMQEAMTAVLERRLGIGKGPKDEDLKLLMKRIAAEALREQLRSVEQ